MNTDSNPPIQPQPIELTEDHWSGLIITVLAVATVFLGVGIYASGI